MELFLSAYTRRPKVLRASLGDTYTSDVERTRHSQRQHFYKRYHPRVRNRLSNLIKSAVLLSYSPLAAKCLHDTLVMDVWDSNRIRIMGTLYSIPDFVSMLVLC